jgi:hypothetical protein
LGHTCDLTERRREVELTDRIDDLCASRDARAPSRPPYEREPHQRIGVVRALEDEPVIALELAVIGREEDVRVAIPSPHRDALEHSPARLVDQLVHDVRHRVDLADAVVRDVLRAIRAGTAFGVDERAVPCREPVRRLSREDALDLVLAARVAGREVEVAPVAAPELARGRVPRMVRIGERHPNEPVVVVRERVEIRDRPIGNPISVVPLTRNRVDARLGRAGVAAGFGREQR